MEEAIGRAVPSVQRAPVVRALDEGIYEISLPPVGFLSYLVLGKERAALIDTGMGIGSLKTVVRSVTDLPVLVINTHGHPDHCGGNAEFSETFINPADLDVFEKMASLEFRRQDIAHMPGGHELAQQLLPTAQQPKPLEDGQQIDLGNRMLRILFAPGHTHGSLCVYDEKTGGVFAGDNVMRRVSLHEWNSGSLSDYSDTLKRLIRLEPSVIYGGHRPNVNTPELLKTLLSLSERALTGDKGEMKNQRGTMAWTLEQDSVSLDYTEEHAR